jgi:exopolysaccharide biosynthesis protein
LGFSDLDSGGEWWASQRPGRWDDRSAHGHWPGGSGQKLIIVVIDGRQPLYCQGAILAELAEIMLYYGTDTAMNLDGGGSSTLVV